MVPMNKYLLFFFLLGAFHIHAQNKEKEGNLTGFFSSFEMQSLGIQPLDSREPDESAVRPGKPGAGFAAGFFIRRQIWRGLDFQPEISIAYFRNIIHYRQEGLQNLDFLDFELPLHMVLVDRHKADMPLNACVIFGPRLGWNMKQNEDKLIVLARERFGLDLGLGAEIRVGDWRIQPALMYSHGLNNLHILSDAQYDSAVGKVFRDKLSLRVSFWRLGKKN